MIVYFALFAAVSGILGLILIEYLNLQKME